MAFHLVAYRKSQRVSWLQKEELDVRIFLLEIPTNSHYYTSCYNTCHKSIRSLGPEAQLPPSLWPCRLIMGFDIVLVGKLTGKR
jgi:hypothetical protein